jgi:hypothetical protein
MRVGVLPLLLRRREGQRKNTRSTRGGERFDMHSTRRTTLSLTVSVPTIICRTPTAKTAKKTEKKEIFLEMKKKKKDNGR